MFSKKIKTVIINLLQKAGVKFIRTKYMPFGIDMYTDLSRICELNDFKFVFDVGANTGQSAMVYAKNFRNAKIFSFEPISETYLNLKNKFQSSENVTPINCAMGSQIGKSVIYLNKKSTQNSLNEYRNIKTLDALAEEISIDTIDNFCLLNNLETIDLLKIDTEGYEMEVIKGAIEKIKNNNVKLILLELGIRKLPQTSFYNSIHDFLTNHGFEVFAFYRQSQSLYSKEVFLMHADVLFINQNWSSTLKPNFKKAQ